MTVTVTESIERRLGVSGKLLIAPVFILAFVTFYSVREVRGLAKRAPYRS